MLWLVVVLVVTNLATLGVLLYFRYGPAEHPAPDAAAAKAIDRALQRTGPGAVRRVITIEILNPIELAGTRGWLAGVAGSFAPGLTRRIVCDQAVRNLKRQLLAERVVADVRVLKLEHIGWDATSKGDHQRDEPAVRASVSEPALPSEVSTRAKPAVPPNAEFGG